MSRSLFFKSISTLLALITTSCSEHQQNTDGAMLHEQAHSLKPIVTLVPVINSTTDHLPWDLSNELTAAIDYRLSSTNSLYLVDLKKTQVTLKKLKHQHNPFTQDISWIKKVFADEEFVVFLELVEHEEVLQQDKKQPIEPALCNAYLNMSMRIRIFDLRDSQPKVVLQELIHNSHFVPRPFTSINFQQTVWGDESFSISPMGLSHASFTKEISQRIQDYILINK